MNRVKRTALFHWLLGLGLLVVTGILWPPLGNQTLVDWVVLSTTVALVGLIHYLGVSFGTTEVSFLPVAVLMAYLTLGLEKGLAAASVGLILGSGMQLAVRWKRLPDNPETWWERASWAAFPVGQTGLSLLAANWSYSLLKARPPLQALQTLQDLLPVIVAIVVFLISFDLILAAHLMLRKVSIAELYRNHRQPFLAIQLLPLALAPLAALSLAWLGMWAYLLFECIVLTIAVVVRRLMDTQDTLQDQVQQLESLSAMNKAIRTTLELDPLLQMVYVQVANLLKVKNMKILLGEPDPETGQWTPQFYARRGQQVQQPPPESPDGFTAWVLKERIPLLAASVEQTAERLGIKNPPPARTWMGIPLRSSNRTLGCMVVWLEANQDPERQFAQTDLELFVTIAIQTEVAMENALLYKEAQQHAAQLARLNQISAVMNASLNPERLLELVASSVIEVAGSDKAAIYLLDEDKHEPALLLTHAQGFSPEHIARSKDIAVPLTDAERKKVMDTAEPVIMPNLHAPGADVSAATILLASREDFVAYAYLPLRAQNRMIGMLAVYYSKPHKFSKTEIELLETFANQAALAVVNAHVYQAVDIQLTRRISQIVRMSDISQRLSATLELDTIFKLIVESAIEGCEADAGVLVIAGNPELGYDDTQPHMVAWKGFDPVSSDRAPHIIAEELAQSEVFRKGETRITSMDDPQTSGPRSQLYVPIFLDGVVAGAIALESEMLNAFNHDDLTFVSQLAVQASVAIRNAQLYRRSQIVRDRLHAILDASNDGLLMIDPKARIVMTNTRMGEFWDFARQDFAPRSPDEFIADPLSSLGEGLGYKEGELNDLIRRGIVNPNIKPETDLYVTRALRGQRQRFVERTATPVRDEQGRFIGLLLIFRDVTEQKELEEARQSLTSMIVHDLRSPLQAVMGSMRLISEVTPQKDPIVQQATEVSQRAVKKLLNLVNNLLDLSRMEQGEFVLDPGIASPKAILEDTAKELMPLAQEIGTMVQVEVPDNIPLVKADRDMIERVVLNLLDNALKYTDPGTLIRLRASVQPAAGKQREDMVCISVADNGPGVPPEYKQAIFDRFAQIPGRKGRRRSAGLGLAFCKMAVESHGGTIWVEDNQDHGSVFSFTLPIVSIPAGETAEDKGLAVKPPEALAAPAQETDSQAKAPSSPPPEPQKLDEATAQAEERSEAHQRDKS